MAGLPSRVTTLSSGWTGWPKGAASNCRQRLDVAAVTDHRQLPQRGWKAAVRFVHRNRQSAPLPVIHDNSPNRTIALSGSTLKEVDTAQIKSDLGAPGACNDRLL